MFKCECGLRHKRCNHNLTNLISQEFGVTGALDLQALQGGHLEGWFEIGGNLTIAIRNCSWLL